MSTLGTRDRSRGADWYRYRSSSCTGQLWKAVETLPERAREIVIQRLVRAITQKSERSGSIGSH